MPPRKLTKQGTSSSISSSGSGSGSGSTTTTTATTATTTTSALATNALPSVLSDGLPLPRAVVFDLDYTLWPFWVDTHVSGPPLRANADHSAVADRTGETFAFYGDVASVLHGLRLAGVRIGVASRTHAPDLGREMLKLLHVPARSSIVGGTGGGGGGGGGGDDNNSNGGNNGGSNSNSNSNSKDDRPRRAIEFFDAGLEIYPSCKIQHFNALHKRTSIPYDQMLFFDDESRNRDTETLGVTMWLVRDGVTWDEVVQGIREWRRRNGIREEPPKA